MKHDSKKGVLMREKDRTMIDVPEILKCASGENSDGTAKALAWLFLDKERHIQAEPDIELPSYRSSPVVYIRTDFEYVLTDLIFPSKTDPDLNTMSSLLNKAFDSMLPGAVPEDEYAFPGLYIQPIESMSDHLIVCSDPVFWALTSITPEDENRVIRLAFNADDVCIFQLEEKTIHVKSRF